MAQKRFFTDYPVPGTEYSGAWRKVYPANFDGDKYVTMADGESFKLGYLRHGHAGGPRVTYNYALRHFKSN